MALANQPVDWIELTMKGLLLARSSSKINPTHVVRFEFNRGEVFIPFCYDEAAVDLSSHDAFNPVGKIPEFKNCADSIDAACQNGIH